MDLTESPSGREPPGGPYVGAGTTKGPARKLDIATSSADTCGPLFSYEVLCVLPGRRSVGRSWVRVSLIAGCDQTSWTSPCLTPQLGHHVGPRGTRLAPGDGGKGRMATTGAEFVLDLSRICLYISDFRRQRPPDFKVFLYS